MVFDYLWALTGVVVLTGAVVAYRKTGDAFHPAVVLAPLFGWFYSLWPFTLNIDGGLLTMFSGAQLDYTGTLFFLAISLLYAGLLRFPRNIRQVKIATQGFLFGLPLPALTKRKIYQLSLFLGVLAVSSYIYSLYNVGGFFKAYSVSKGGGHVDSGWISEAILLSFPAVLLLSIAVQGKRMVRAQDIVLALVLVSPHLLQGTFGGRRGPLFLSLSLLFFAWYVAKGRPPSFSRVILALGTISLLVLVVASQRQFVYIGSSDGFDGSRALNLIQPTTFGRGGEEGNEYVMAVGTILTADYWRDYRWGRGYFINYVIRPIPKEVWPTKYEDMGVAALGMSDEATQSRYFAAVGFVPLAGSSTGSIADVYSELAWGVLVVFYALGRVFSLVWQRHRLRGGIWTVLLIEMLILSVYLPAQSLSAWLQRLLYMGVISALLWKYWIHVKPPPKTLAAR